MDLVGEVAGLEASSPLGEGQPGAFLLPSVTVDVAKKNRPGEEKGE